MRLCNVSILVRWNNLSHNDEINLIINNLLLLRITLALWNSWQMVRLIHVIEIQCVYVRECRVGPAHCTISTHALLLYVTILKTSWFIIFFVVCRNTRNVQRYIVDTFIQGLSGVVEFGMFGLFFKRNPSTLLLLLLCPSCIYA